jgi:hypothetical protein
MTVGHGGDAVYNHSGLSHSGNWDPGCRSELPGAEDDQDGDRVSHEGEEESKGRGRVKRNSEGKKKGEEQ